MSISTTRNFLEKSGCGIVVGVVLCAVMAVGLFQGCGAQSQGQATEAPKVAAFTVGQNTIGLAELEAYVERTSANRERQIRNMPEMGRGFEGFSPTDRMTLFSNALGELVTAAINLELAKQVGVSMTEETAKSQLLSQLDQQIAAAQQQLQQQGKIKANATQAEISAVFQSEFGQTPEQIRQAQSTAVSEAMQDAATKIVLMGQAAQPAYVEKRRTQLTVSDEDLSKIFDSVKLKSILFRERPGQNRNAEAEKVLADIKSGKLTFEAAMEQFSDNPAPEGKRKQDREDVLSSQFLLLDTAYTPVRNLKQGEISQVIDGVDGPIIYKVIGFQSDKPADFEANKTTHRANHLMFLANQEYYEKLRAARTNMVKFGNKGLELVYRGYTLVNDPIVEQNWRAIYDEAKEARDPASAPFSMIAEYQAMGRVRASLTGPELAAFRPMMIDTLRTVLTRYEGAGLRMQLVDLLIEARDETAGEELLRAARSNNTFGRQGQNLNDTIGAKLEQLRKANLVSSTTATEIEQAQASWITNKREHDENLKRQQEQIEKERQEAEAARKRAEEEAAQARQQQGQAPQGQAQGQPQAPAQGQGAGATGGLPGTSGN